MFYINDFKYNLEDDKEIRFVGGKQLLGFYNNLGKRYYFGERVVLRKKRVN